MVTIDRRTFLSGITGSLLAVPAAARPAPSAAPACWLDIAAPFVVVDPAQSLSTEILLTATCFPGADGYRDPHFATEYEVLLYDASGKPLALDRDGRFEVRAMHPTLLDPRRLSGRDAFFGGAKIRVAPSSGQMTHAGDLFSAGFVRWNLPSNFDNVHAQPAPPQQVFGRFNYSMPFPALSEYHCAFALFNPNEEPSWGVVRVVDRMGRAAVERPYRLRPHQSVLYSLADLKPAETPGEALAIAPLAEPKLAAGGVVVVRNDSDKAAFAYTFMKGRQGGSFTVEHPLHFAADAPIKKARATPYGANRSFPAQALVYTPMIFRGLRTGGVTLESRVYFSASRWQEEALWLMPFVTTGKGDIAWVSNRDDGFASRVTPAAHADQGLLRLGEFQSAAMDCRGLPLPEGFSGGLGVATIPKTSHSLLKVEVRAAEWGRVAFTHFRPGGNVAKAYRRADGRGGLATDYIVSGVHVMRGRRDCLLAVMNIEFEDDQAGTPRLQLFGASGLMAEKTLDAFPPLACRHLLVSELFTGVQSDPDAPFTLRMQVPEALMIVSALHLDYERRDLALEHGSDRHSTFQDFKC
ncbi:MAG TPA: hypothetical protein VKX45_20535 [Bryobacteraceae bacterium]|jgi:hypothetical protein|nr:hypothetical protein [Bryobacteraceae bacterium]